MACCAPLCPSRTTVNGEKTPGISFHMFPRSAEMRNAWIKAIRRDNWEPNKHSRLCSKHFEESCFMGGLKVRKLKTDAIPTKFQGYHNHQRVTKRRKALQFKDIPIELTPKQKKLMEEYGIKENECITPRHTISIISSLSKARQLASRRLRLIKQIRESRRRLIKKNATLTNIISDLKNKQAYYLICSHVSDPTSSVLGV